MNTSLPTFSIKLSDQTHSDYEYPIRPERVRKKAFTIPTPMETNYSIRKLQQTTVLCYKYRSQTEGVSMIWCLGDWFRWLDIIDTTGIYVAPKCLKWMTEAFIGVLPMFKLKYVPLTFLTPKKLKLLKKSRFICSKKSI